MRTIRHTSRFKKDYKRETKGWSLTSAKKLDAELAAVVQVLMVDGTLDLRYRDHPLLNEWKDHRETAISGPIWC
jgi:mRNA interferase YafQ